MTDTLKDYITGRELPDVGAEANRQMVEHLLVEGKKYRKEDIEVGTPISIALDEDRYQSRVDLVVRVGRWRFMVVKCAPGSLASYEREVIAAARLLDSYQIPLAVASDGRTALVWNTIDGKSLGSGLSAIPTLHQAQKMFDPQALQPLAASRIRRQQLIFRSYDSMHIHREANP